VTLSHDTRDDPRIADAAARFLLAQEGPREFRARAALSDTDRLVRLLVRNRDQGAALSAQLGGHSIALMRGHGFVAVGDTIPIAVYRAIYTQVNAALQQNAIALGGTIVFLDPDEAALARTNIEPTIQRPWELWKRSATGS